MQSQPAQLLALLLAHPGAIVTRDQIRATLWPDTTVAYDQNINFAIRQIRIALGVDAQLVQTVPRRGYRFVGTVECPAVAAQRPTRRAVSVAAAVALALAAGFGAGIVVRDAPTGQFVDDHLVHPGRCPYVRMLLPTHATHKNSSQLIEPGSLTARLHGHASNMQNALASRRPVGYRRRHAGDGARFRGCQRRHSQRTADRPYPYPGLPQLQLVRDSRPRDGAHQGRPIAVADFLDARQSARAFSSLVAWRPALVVITGAGAEPERVQSIAVTANFFATLGVTPILGGPFPLDSDTAGRDTVVIVSRRLWRSRFGADSSLIGRDIGLNGRATTVVGVIRDEDCYPPGIDAWTPLVFSPSDAGERAAQRVWRWDASRTARRPRTARVS